MHERRYVMSPEVRVVDSSSSAGGDWRRRPGGLPFAASVRVRPDRIQTPAQIERMRAAGLVVGRTLQLLTEAARPGATTAELDALAEDSIRSSGAVPSFKGYADPPFPAPVLRMVDRIDGYQPAGGRHGLGLVRGSIAVDPAFWFFQAHFYQDPVWPGSLGLESFLQLLKYAAWKRWGNPPAGGWRTVALDRPHTWSYRGQVVPADREVTVLLEVTAADDAARRLSANGFLTVDGRVIYQMTDFTLE